MLVLLLFLEDIVNIMFFFIQLYLFLGSALEIRYIFLMSALAICKKCYTLISFPSGGILFERTTNISASSFNSYLKSSLQVG